MEGAFFLFSEGEGRKNTMVFAGATKRKKGQQDCMTKVVVSMIFGMRF